MGTLYRVHYAMRKMRNEISCVLVVLSIIIILKQYAM